MNPNLHMFIIIVLAFSMITVEENLPNIVIKKNNNSNNFFWYLKMLS